MATVLESNLYPPIIDTYMPAFLASKESCNIYFGLSNFNSVSEIHRFAQVTVKMQRTNKNALGDQRINPNDNNSKVLNTGIVFLEIKQDPIRGTDDKYYVTLPDNILADSYSENIDQYYKIQIRFMKRESIPAEENIEEGKMIKPTFLNNYLNYFSEWSTVCLIRPISNPIVSVENFLLNSDENETDVDYIFKDNFLYFTGKITFSSLSETERLSKYKVSLINQTEHQTVEESPILYSGNYNNKNAMYYNFNINFADANPTDIYRLSIQYETNNGYTKTETLDFKVKIDKNESINYTLSIRIDEEQGQNILTPIKQTEDNITNYFLFYVRTSNKSDFTVWETIGIKDDHSPFYDRTIESGVWYEYGIQRVIWVAGTDGEPSHYIYDKIGPVIQETTQSTDHSPHYENDENIEEDYDLQALLKNKNIYSFNKNQQVHICVINNFDDEFINAEDTQLKVKYDNLPNSFKKNISENKIDTIGSQYPFIRRNSTMNYKQFGIRGLITVQDEDNDIFISDVELYKSSTGKQLYKEFNQNNNIQDFNDYVKEREYRERIVDFLYKDSIKLIRNLTEGNIIGKIMDINLTPNTTLGNLIYSFSGTFYEIDDFTLANVYKYNIISIPITLQQAIKAYGSKKGVTNNG